MLFSAFLVLCQSGYIGVLGGADDESDISFVKFHIPEGAQLLSAFFVLTMSKCIYRASCGVQVMNLTLV